METVLPWEDFLAVIEPHYPKPGNSRPPIPLPVMLRIYFMQQWFGLSDPAAEEFLIDVESVRRFAGVDARCVPDETTICKFRHRLQKYNRTQQLFALSTAHLTRKGLILEKGSIVDATIIHAPSSTKNKERKRDPEMTSTKKGNTWHFGMKAHVGTDTQGSVYSVEVTTVSTGKKSVSMGIRPLSLLQNS